MQTKKILIVDDESSIRSALFRIFSRRGYTPLTANSVKEAEEIIVSSSQLDLALIDVHLNDGNGLSLMMTLKQKFHNLPIIVLTGQASIDNAVQATRLGAYHFMTKPFSIEELVNISEKAFSHNLLVEENSELRTRLKGRYHFDNIVGKSNAIMDVLRMVERVADTDSTVLVTGESGTGKELIAKAIHYNSSRSSRPFIPINCGAIPSELLESELFGHVKGAFTGAIHNRQGRFELANKGTLFLDEIGDLSPPLQVKLLRVLQEKRFEPVGSAKTIESDVRIVAATNSNLQDMVKNGKFREDLFYRLNVIPIKIPPLRERRDDVVLLLNHFLQIFNSKKGISLQGIHPFAMEKLTRYDWPGNIRELENLVERISILKKEGLIELSDIPSYFDNVSQKNDNIHSMEIPDEGIDFNSKVAHFENQLIVKALNKTGWNRNQAARLLRLNRTTLVEKIKKKGLKPEDFTGGL